MIDQELANLKALRDADCMWEAFSKGDPENVLSTLRLLDDEKLTLFQIFWAMQTFWIMDAQTPTQLSEGVGFCRHVRRRHPNLWTKVRPSCAWEWPLLSSRFQEALNEYRTIA